MCGASEGTTHLGIPQITVWGKEPVYQNILGLHQANERRLTGWVQA